MKTFCKLAIITAASLSFQSCSTTTTAPDGTITVRRPDGKTIMVLVGAVGQIGAAAAVAAAQAAVSNQSH